MTKYWILAALVLISAETRGEDLRAATCPSQSEVRIRPQARLEAPEGGFDTVSIYDKSGNRTVLEGLVAAGGWTVQREQYNQIANLTRIAPERYEVLWASKIEKDKQCRQPLYAPDPGVRRVSPLRAGLGDEIIVEIVDLEVWLDEQKASRLTAQDLEVKDLVLYLDGVPLYTVKPSGERATPLTGPNTNGHSSTNLRFKLELTEANKANWKRLFDKPTWSRPVAVSVGFPEYEPMFARPVEGDNLGFELIILRKAWAVTGLLVILGALIAFFVLMWTTDIVRDPLAPLRPDGESPWSLSRLQMAFWFFLVITAYLLLFVLIRATDTITNSVLALIGISAGTAISAALIDASKYDPVERFRNLLTTQNKDEALKKIRSEMTDVKARMDTAATAEEKEPLIAEIRRLELQQRFLGQKPWQRFMEDILGDGGAISFHRFQIAVWTLVMSVVFLHRVLTTLSMPDFSSTVLGLMGISSGTYIGFKFPEQK